jgi:DNA-binding winged helix-turn-helix (wHTH) protein
MDDAFRYYPVSRRLEYDDRSVRLTPAEGRLLIAAAAVGKHGITWASLAERVRRGHVSDEAASQNHMRQVLHSFRHSLIGAGLPVLIEAVRASGVVCVADVEMIELQPQQETAHGPQAEVRADE